MRKNLIIISMLLVFTGPVSQGLSSDLVRIGGSPYPISTFEENSQIVGLDFDIVELILKEAGITRVERVLKPWKRIIHDLDTGRVDMVVPMVFTREREEKYLLAPSIRPRFNIVLVQSAYQGKIHSIADLKGLTVGKCDGYAYQEEFVQAAVLDMFTPGYCLDNEMGLRKLRLGRFDAFMIGEGSAMYLINQMGFRGEFKYTGYRAEKSSHVGFNKASSELYNLYLTGFRSAQRQGLIDAVVQTWKTLYAIE